MRRIVPSLLLFIWGPLVSVSNSNIINDYAENIAYDANGNILKYLRNGTTQGGNQLGMDSLNYYYDNKTNQLNAIHDSCRLATTLMTWIIRVQTTMLMTAPAT